MNKNTEKFSMQNRSNQRASDLNYYEGLNQYWDDSIGTNLDKLRAFTKYVPFGEFPRLFARYEIFKKIVGIHGSVVECGVHQGTGIMSWAILSTLFEPINHIRKVIGFDTFEGFTNISDKDITKGNEHLKAGGLAVDAQSDVLRSIELLDQFRPLGHIPKVELIKGDAVQTIPAYLKDNPHTVVALLYLDFDLYEPTKAALEHLISRMPKGAIIAFDELANSQWPGETMALIDSLGIRNLELKRFYFQPQICYAEI